MDFNITGNDESNDSDDDDGDIHNKDDNGTFSSKKSHILIRKIIMLPVQFLYLCFPVKWNNA